ncbi:hypothetical protein STEG23_023202 [Scotinomys teguina]
MPSSLHHLRRVNSKQSSDEQWRRQRPDSFQGQRMVSVPDKQLRHAGKQEAVEVIVNYGGDHSVKDKTCVEKNLKSQANPKSNRGFGSTGTDLTFLSLDLDQRPILELTIDNKKISGLLDTGADRSIIARKDWPSGWPVQMSSQTLQGLGYAKTPDISTRQLLWKDGIMQPYVLELPISLWDWDLMTDMGFRLSNNYSTASRNMMMAKDKNILEQAYVDLTVLLRKKGLVIAPEKDQRDPVWVPEHLVRKIQHREDHGKEDSDHPACSCDDANGDDRPEMGDPVVVSELMPV